MCKSAKDRTSMYVTYEEVCPPLQALSTASTVTRRTVSHTAGRARPCQRKQHKKRVHGAGPANVRRLHPFVALARRCILLRAIS